MKLRRFWFPVVIAAGCFAMISSVAAGAAPKVSSTPSWISLHEPTGVASFAAWEPGLGDMVTFDAGYPSNVRNPRVDLKCYQNGVLVYGETASLDQAAQADLTGQAGLTLGGGGSIWLTKGGAADCVATLFYYSQKAGQQIYNNLARDDFRAAG